MDDVFEGFLFPAEILGTFGFIPDGRVFQFGVDLLEFL